MRVRVWEASDVVDAVLRNYDRLPEDIRSQIPLKRVWMLTDGGL
jgi:restriction system protein